MNKTGRLFLIGAYHFSVRVTDEVSECELQLHFPITLWF